jgi:CheY-like chemotaxis protein
MPGERYGDHIVLLVEDDPVVQSLVQSTLAMEGIGVVMATDGLEALDTARSRSADMAILDVMLPGMDGVFVAERLHQMFGNDFPILVLTAHPRIGDKAERMGAYQQLSKPFDLERLIQAVNKGLALADDVSRRLPEHNQPLT